MTGSFKERGARNTLLQLSGEERKRGVIAASAGNHALGLAYHGGLLGVPVTVVMPKFAPLVKVVNCRGFGAEVVIFGETFDEAKERAGEIQRERGMLYVNGFDDEAIIAGAGTLGLEVLEDVPGVDAVVVPVGGGGLIAGMGVAVKGVRPEVRVIGVEPVHAPTLAVSLKKGEVTRVATRPTLADGLGVGEAGRICCELARRVVDQVVLVDEDAIARAVLRLLELEKMVVEGAGAVGLAAMTDRERLRIMGLEGKKVVLVLTGGNIDVTMISRVIDRGLGSDGRLARVTVDVADRPGALAKVLGMVAERGGSIQEVRHDRHFGPADVALVRIFFVIETRDEGHVREIREGLEAGA